MYFDTTKQSFLKALLKVNSVIEKKSTTIPILQNIKIEVNNETVSLTGTDLDILVSSNFTVNPIAAKNGSITVNSQILIDIIKKTQEDSQIIINQEADCLSIKNGRSKFKIATISADEFPVMLDDLTSNEVELDAKIISSMIDRTKFAISNDETRYNLNGIFFELINRENDKPNQIRTVATDGHKLSFSFTETTSNDLFGVIIPKKAVAEISKIIEGNDKVIINVSDVKIKIKTNDAVIISKLIDSEFPQYEKVIPKNNNNIVKINKQSLIGSIGRVAIVATDNHHSIKLSFSNNKLILEANSSESGSAYEEIDIDYSGNDIEIGFNARYLADTINQIDKEELIMKLKDGLSPVIIEAENMQSMFVIMPIRV